uniref:WD repeat domain phosphoinositide-interacting protein 2 n=1 Tax=Plectus sambesii TaxID=2011161 RepID=A0A914W3D8_9BILA
MATFQHDSGVLFANFNQDATSLAVGTKKGYTLYSLTNIDELQKIHESNEVEETCLIERLFSSSLVTLVSLSAPRKLRVCHFQKGTEICSHSYTNAILSVRLNRLRVVVCLEESLYVHNIRDMKVLHTIRDTPPNTHGLCDLTAGDVSYVAYPGSANVGEVHIFDGANLQAVTIISAHDSPVAALKFNSEGTKLATASEKGTVIRVFDVLKGEKLFEFRRGVKRCVTIYSLAFSADSMYLCSSSNTETLHVFKLDAHNRHQGDNRTASDDESSGTSAPATGVQGWVDYMSRTAVNYLPTQMTDILHQDRSFATAKLPAVGARNVVAIAR